MTDTGRVIGDARKRLTPPPETTEDRLQAEVAMLRRAMTFVANRLNDATITRQAARDALRVALRGGRR